MMNEAMKNEVYTFAKEVRVNKTKLMEMVERVVAMVETNPTKVGKVKMKKEAQMNELKNTFGYNAFTVKDANGLVKDTHYLLRKLEAEGLVTKVGKVEKTGRGRPDFMWKFVEVTE